MASKDIDVPEKLIRRLSDLLKATDLSEIELSTEGFKLKVKAKEQPSPSYFASVAPSAPVVTQSPPSSLGQKSEKTDTDLHIVRSPFVGTFYSAASPNSDAYVELGQTISKGQVMCIVEAMKIMNEIESDVSGKIEKIYAENGTPVDFNAPLFGIRK